MKMMNFRLCYMLMIIALAPMAIADNYFDDDIYYDASKAKKNKKREVVITKTPEVSKIESEFLEVDYNTYNGLMRDVDEYNRQGVYSTYSDTLGSDSILNMDGYTYTNRIERFYNPEVVSGSGNQELINSYSENQPVVNIYVDSFWNPYPSWSWGYSYPWYSWNYTFYTGVWNPYWTSYRWYNPWYNPWYWDPYCYHYPYYGHHHHHGPAYYPHHSSVRPAPSGAYRPHRSGNRTGGVSRPGYTRNNRNSSNSSIGARTNTNRGRVNAVGTPSNNTPNRSSVSRPNNRANRNNSSSVSSNSNRSKSNSSYSRPNNSSSSRSSSYSRSSSSSSRSSGFSGGSRGGSGSRGRR